MDYDPGSASQDVRDEDEDEESEEVDGGNRLLGFMFGNVDNSGDLDVDYLDEDAKEHLAALANELSLKDIDLSAKSPQIPADTAEQDYDEKAEDAVDYEDFDEQYEGPEVQAASEEDYLLPKNEYFSSNSMATLESTASVFDDENYDEDDEFEKEHDMVDKDSEVQTIISSGDQDEHLVAVSETPKDDIPPGSLEAENIDVNPKDFQEEPEVLEDAFDGQSFTPLPILYVEDGTVILRFSEIFGVHEPLKKAKKRDHRYSIPKERYTSIDASVIVEEDEEAFLKGSFQALSILKETHMNLNDISAFMDDNIESEENGVVQGFSTMSSQDVEQKKNSCLSAEPMNEGETVDMSAGWQSPFNSKFYPLDQHDWENRIIWNNSPTASDNSAESCDISGPDSETMVNREIKFETGAENCQSELQVEPDEKEHNFSVCSASALVEPFGSRNSTQLMNLPVLGGRYHPQLLRLESRLEVDNSDHSYVRKENVTEESCQSDALRRLSKLTLQNREIIEGSWLDRIIWEPHEPIVKPKLIFDLQDEQMLFEILDNKDGNHLQLHAGAMIITHSLKSSSGDSFELSGHGGQSGGRFNIANDKFYSNRESSPQLKSHSKKRTAHGVKVLHSTPALKLQTVKLRLNNKDIANFHRPKALWYPHDNEVALKELRKLTTHGGLMKVILKCLGGKGCRLHVDANETVSSVKAEASKKLDFKLSETVKIFFSGKELEDNKSLAAQNVQPNSLLHLVRTRIHLLPRAQKLPGENKSLRPPGAFKKKSDLSAKDGHVFLMEYCEERPLLLGNVGMGARLCTYYMKSAPGDNTGTLLRNENSNLGSVLTLDPADKSPFLGDIKPGCSQSSLETNMYRAPIFPHKVTSTDYLLVRSPKGKLSIRRIDRIDVVGQQEPHMEVMSPGTKGLQTYNLKRLLVYAYREFRTVEKHGLQPRIRADELSAQFPNSTEAYLRKQLKHCADFRRGSNGQMFWVMKPNFRIPSEEELRRMVTPENVCANESMLAGLYRLKHLGIMKLTNPAGISSAMNQLPDEAIALAAASHIERELQITPWNLTSNFVGRNNQGRENIERLEITGVGDPSGRGLGFSYVRTAPKAPISSAVVKKKASVVRGGSTVTGTDADLRRLSMEAAREVLLKFNVQEEQIAKQTRWHRIAMIRKLSSEQAASGVKVDPTTISKYARGQRMSFLQLQQQTREKCQEIWDRQVQSLSAIEGDENESDSEANSDLDSFAGDLENLLDAEEGEEGEEGNYESKHEKADGVRGLKMRRLSSQAQAEEEIEDEAAEAADLCRMLVDEDEAERKKKKKTIAVREELGSVLGFGIENAERVKRTNTLVKQNFSTPQPVGPFASKENINRDPKEVESFHVKRNLFGKVKGMKKNDISGIASFNKKVKIIGDGLKANIKGKKSARESFVCGACGQHGHMRTNKNCPKYGEDVDAQPGTTELDKASGGKTSSLDPSSQSQQKTIIKKLIPKSATKIALVEAVEGDNSGSKAKTLKFKCGSVGDKSTERPAISDTETNKSGVGVKVNKIIISNKMKPEDVQQVESHKPSIIIRPPSESAERDMVVDSDKSSRPPIDKPSIVIRPPTDRERSVPRKKIIIKQPKEILNLDQEGSTGFEYRKTKRIAELSSIEKKPKHQGSKLSSEDLARRKARRERWEEEEKRRNAERLREERARMKYEEEMRLVEEQERFAEISRYEEAIRREREEEERQKAEKRKKKKRKPETRDVYLEEEYQQQQQQHGSSSSRRRSVGGGDRRMPDRERSAKRRPVIELGKYGAEYVPPTKRRRVGEVGLANILEKMVEMLKERIEVSYLFLKPVSKKEAPDYLDIIEHPMDLSTIREKVRKLDYKSREEFRHDVWQITFNAHKYNDGRNPGIPPLADQLLELCDYLLAEHDPALSEAEAGIQRERHLH